MEKRFPFDCCRCGMCCMAEVCPIGKDASGIPDKGEPCIGLEWDGDEARCLLFHGGIKGQDEMGIGRGCCIKARVIAGGREFDFSGLSDELKRGLVKRIREGDIKSNVPVGP